MNIYFACSITGGRRDEDVYQHIVEALVAAGHEVPTFMLTQSDVKSQEMNSDEVVVYERDTAWIRGCDALVAEISTPSHGVGYEIGYALNLSKPVICLHRQGIAISKMISGNRDENLSVLTYTSPDEAVKILQDQLSVFT